MRADRDPMFAESALGGGVPIVTRPGGTTRQLAHFLVVGGLTVLVDFVTYRTVIATDIGIAPAKGIGFVTGTVFAYFANRRWTFAGSTHRRGSALRFALLYAITLAINVATNALLLRITTGIVPTSVGVAVAFIGATGVSAVLNFVGLKFFVFEATAAP